MLLLRCTSLRGLRVLSRLAVGTRCTLVLFVLFFLRFWRLFAVLDFHHLFEHQGRESGSDWDSKVGPHQPRDTIVNHRLRNSGQEESHYTDPSFWIDDAR